METAPSELVEALLAMPLFEDVDGELLDGVRAEAEIRNGTFTWEAGVARRESFLQFRDLGSGDTALAQGTLTTAFVVVLSGSIEELQARPGREPFSGRLLGPGDWFGEASGVANHPALATYRARGRAMVAMLEERLFKRLFEEAEPFKERVLDGYRALIGLHLRLTTLCRDLDDAALAKIESAAELRTFEDQDPIAAAGDDADTVFVVRSGAVGAFVASDRGERVLAYYKGNASFGEHTLLSEAPTFAADYRALMQTTLIALPRSVFARLDPPARRGLLRAADRLVTGDDARAAATGSAADVGGLRLLDELFVMVERESAKGGRALVIDRQRCVRCNMCVESCVAVHDDGVPRLSKVGTPVASDEVLVTACYHCETPQCMLNCNYAAIRRDPQGRVRFEYDNCVGCAQCIDGCPYGVIRLLDPAAPPSAPPPSLLQRFLGGLFGSPPPRPSPAVSANAEDKPRSVGAGGSVSPVGGKTLKCDLCAGLPFEACVYNCPTTAIVRREPQSLFEPRRAR